MASKVDERLKKKCIGIHTRLTSTVKNLFIKLEAKNTALLVRIAAQL